jgi:hypothetical protein
VNAEAARAFASLVSTPATSLISYLVRHGGDDVAGELGDDAHFGRAALMT